MSPPDNILPLVSLTPRAVEMWTSHCREAARRLRILPEDCGEEVAKVCPRTGDLIVSCDLCGGGAIICRIPPAEWAWSDGRN